MKQYKEYMNSVEVPPELHQKLTELTAPKRAAGWKKYGAMAAALALVVGAGAFGLSRMGRDDILYETAEWGDPEPVQCAAPLAPEVAGGYEDTRTIGGYEVHVRFEETELVNYCLLPYIAYGEGSGTAADLSLAPPDGGLRDVTWDDVLALLGWDEEALSAHLDWGGYELGGTVGFEADGTVWMMSVHGTSDDGYFGLELSPDRLPPSCVVAVGEEKTVTEVWGVEVSGKKNVGAYGDTERGVFLDVTREVEFIANGVGCRFKAYGIDDDAVELFTARFVRWAVLEGLNLYAISPDGAVPAEPQPSEPAGEPTWEDGASSPSQAPQEGGGTPAYDPNA